MKPFFGKTIGVLVVCTILCGATYGAEQNEAVANTEHRLNQKIEDITVSGIDLAQLLSLLQEQTGVALVIGNGSDKKVTFSLTKPTLRDTLFAALYPIGLGYRVRPNGAVVIDEEAKLLKDFGPGPQPPAIDPQNKEKTLAAMNQRLEDLTVSGIDLSQLLTLLQAQSGAQMVLGEGIDQKVTFSLSQPTLREILDTVLPLYDLGYRIRDNGVLIVDQASRLESLFGTAPEQTTSGDVVTLELETKKHPTAAYVKALKFYSNDLYYIVNENLDTDKVTIKTRKNHLGELQKILEKVDAEEFIYVPGESVLDTILTDPGFLKWVIGLLPEKVKIDETRNTGKGLRISGSNITKEQFNEMVGNLMDIGQRGYQPSSSKPTIQFLVSDVNYFGFESEKSPNGDKPGFWIHLNEDAKSRETRSEPRKPQIGRGYKISYMTKDRVGLMAYDGKEGFYQVGDVVQESVFGNFKIESINPNPKNPWIRVKSVDSSEDATIAAR